MRLNEMKRAEAPSKLFAALAKVFVIMVGRRARQELRMQVTKAKIDELIEGNGGELLIAPDICGDFTIARYFNMVPTAATSMNKHPVSRFRRIINKDIEAVITAAPNQSVDSVFEDMHIKVMQELESSDYVSTLRDP
jgi:hypothetical protein